MQQYQTRVRRMRRPGLHHGRSTDGVRQAFRDDEIIRAKAAAQRAAQAEARDSEQEK